MHILVTNDDGIDAPGLAALVEVARSLGEVTIVAPHCHRSGCSHAATSDQSLHLVERGPRHFALCGTPVDCVRVALLHLDPRIELVLSGINDGGNLGVDVLMSGTVAAAREAALLGRPGSGRLAVSTPRPPAELAPQQPAGRGGLVAPAATSRRQIGRLERQPAGHRRRRTTGHRPGTARPAPAADPLRGRGRSAQLRLQLSRAASRPRQRCGRVLCRADRHQPAADAHLATSPAAAATRFRRPRCARRGHPSG